MDIEGAEWFALRGMQSILERDRPLLLVEINHAAMVRLGYDAARIWDLLAGDLGYRAWAIGESARTCHTLISLAGIERRNVLFHAKGLSAAVTTGWDLKSVLRWARGVRS
jgi:hypothetical protein